MADRSLYDTDFALWSAEQAAAIRAAASSGANLPLDWENLAEGIESLGKLLRRELGSRMAVIIEHLLKLQISPAAEPPDGWIATIVRERSEIEQLLDDNPSLRGQLAERFATATRWGRQSLERGLRQHGELSHAGGAELLRTDLELSQVLGDWFPAQRQSDS